MFMAMTLLNESHNISGEYNNYKCLGVGTNNPIKIWCWLLKYYFNNSNLLNQNYYFKI